MKSRDSATSPRFRRATEQEEPGTGQPRAPDALRGALDRVRPNPCGSSRASARRPTRGDHAGVEAGRLHLGEQLLGRTDRVDPHRGQGNPEPARRIRGTAPRPARPAREGRVDQLERVRAGDARYVLDLVDDLGGGPQAVQAALEARVRAVGAAEGTAPFGLDRPGEAPAAIRRPIDPALEARRPEARQTARRDRGRAPVSSRAATPGMVRGSRPSSSAASRAGKASSPSPRTAKSAASTSRLRSPSSDTAGPPTTT